MSAPQYVAGKTIKVGLELRRAGDPVPEASGWSAMALRAALGVGEVVVLYEGQVPASTPRLARQNIEDAKANPDAPLRDPILPPPPPLRDRRDEYEKSTTPGAPTSGRILRTWLKDDDDQWVEVKPGAYELPSDRLAAAADTDLDIDDLAAEAAKRGAMQERLKKARAAKSEKAMREAPV